MSHRIRWVLVVVLSAGVVIVGAGFAVFALTGGDAPPAPKLSTGSAATGTVNASGRWRPSPAPGTFVGYRVDEEYLGVGVRTAVGRTRRVTGRLDIRGGEVRHASLEADLRTLRSDEARRDEALRTRAIETDRYPTARFDLSRPVALTAAGRRAVGLLELHGRRAPIVVELRGQRLSTDRVELVGSAMIRFADFAIAPPSVAHLVTVRDHGILEFRLLMQRARR